MQLLALLMQCRYAGLVCVEKMRGLVKQPPKQAAYPRIVIVIARVITAAANAIGVGRTVA